MYELGYTRGAFDLVLDDQSTRLSSSLGSADVYPLADQVVPRTIIQAAWIRASFVHCPKMSLTTSFILHLPPSGSLYRDRDFRFMDYTASRERSALALGML